MYRSYFDVGIYNGKSGEYGGCRNGFAGCLCIGFGAPVFLGRPWAQILMEILGKIIQTYENNKDFKRGTIDDYRDNDLF